MERSLYLSPPTTLSWIKFISFANCDKRLRVWSGGNLELADFCRLIHNNKSWVAAAGWIKQQDSQAQAECLQDPRGFWPGKAFAHSEVAEGGCARGGSMRRKTKGIAQKAVLLYFIILLGLDIALKILNLEENGSRKLRYSVYQQCFIWSNLKVAISWHFEDLLIILHVFLWQVVVSLLLLFLMKKTLRVTYGHLEFSKTSSIFLP